MEREDAAYREATRSLLRKRLDHGPPLLLDGAIGSELERRGVPASLPLWSSHALLTHPEVLAAVHADYVAAGAEILTANSFRTQRRTLKVSDLPLGPIIGYRNGRRRSLPK